eukprot:COSAG05_NODE_665_length_8009_cov_156.415929_8_plen_353_part_00
MVNRGCLKGKDTPAAKVACALWYIGFPFILVYYSIIIYLLPCILSYAIGACGKCWLAIGKFACICCDGSRFCHRISCCICLRYEDNKDFPANAKSIGPWKGKSESDIDNEIEWVRGNAVFNLPEGEHAKLFSGGIEPSDIGQGQLGDCWLMTSLACMAEFPGAIQNCFLTDEYNERGRYVLQLYCGYEKKFEHVEVDDLIPVQKGKRNEPIFAKPHGQELWVSLLEKAFAKFMGSYQALDGGYMLYGLQVLTGDKVNNWALKNDGRWVEHEIRYKSKTDVGFWKTKSAAKSVDEFWKTLVQWDEAECIIAAATSGQDEGTATAMQGLVQGHAYSVITCMEVCNFKMLKLRNP